MKFLKNNFFKLIFLLLFLLVTWLFYELFTNKYHEETMNSPFDIVQVSFKCFIGVLKKLIDKILSFFPSHVFFFEPICLSLITIITLLISIAYFTLAERKIIASVQRRRGPNIVGF
jgi:hypothetical protein